MAINSKNKKAENLAKQLAEKTAETITDAIIPALADRLERVEGSCTTPDLVNEIMAIASRCNVLSLQDNRTPEEILG